MEEIEFYDKVMEKAGLKDREEARKITKAVLETLAARLPQSEIEDLSAQFPAGIKAAMSAAKFEKMHLHEFLSKIKEKAELPDIKAAEANCKAVFAVTKKLVSKGEVDDITAVLPLDLKPLWAEA